MNRKGAWDGILITIIVLALIVFFYYVFSGDAFVVNTQAGGKSIWDKSQQTVSYKDALNEKAAPLDYLFGGIPQYLIDWTKDPTEDKSYVAPIIMIGIWLLLLLTFGDLLSIFGFFTKPVAWVVAVVITIIAANLKFIAIISVTMLSITAFLGALSVFASIAGVFVMFIMFHFGTAKLRERMILRKAQDSAIRAVAGGKRAASGISVLKDIVAEAEKGEK